MKYVSVAQIAKKWGVSERTVRNYCAEGKIPEAFLTGKTWNIPEDAQRPDRINIKRDEPETLLDVLRTEKASGTKGGIYHKVQIELTYNSNQRVPQEWYCSVHHRRRPETVLLSRLTRMEHGTGISD